MKPETKQSSSRKSGTLVKQNELSKSSDPEIVVHQRNKQEEAEKKVATAKDMPVFSSRRVWPD